MLFGSTPRVVISTGEIEIRNGNIDALDGLHHDTTTAHRALHADDIAGMQDGVNQSSQAGELLGEIGELLLDEGIRNMLNPKLYRVFCIQ